MVKDSIMEILKRIESKQTELAAKLDNMHRLPSKFVSVVPKTSELDVAVDASPGGAEPGECSKGPAVKAPHGALEIDDTMHGDMSSSGQTKTLTNDHYGQKEVAIVDFYDAMGWQKQFEEVFEVPKGADCLTRFARGPVWTLLSVGMILINTVLIGVEIQLVTSYHLQKALHREGGWPAPSNWDDSAFHVIETLFLAWMVFELLVNVYAQRKAFLFGPDWRWNVFDVLVLMTAIVRQVYEFANVGFLRVARLLRLARMLRAFRVFKFFRGIRSMLISLSGSMMHLFSAMLVMSLFMYTVALIFMQSIASETEPGGMLEGIADVSSANPRDLTIFNAMEEGNTLVQNVYMLYGGVGRTMMTLFMTITGGLEWKRAAWPVAELGWVYAALWTCYITFMVFGMLNVLTGIFVDAAFQVMMGDRDNIIQTQMEERHSLINKIRRIFHDSDTDDSGLVTMDEFRSLLKNPEMVAYLNAIGIDSSEAHGLFRLLDYDNSGEVSVDEFVTGFLRLKGGAKAVDMVTLLFENRKLSSKLNRIFDEARCANININNLMGGVIDDCPRGPRSAWSARAGI